MLYRSTFDKINQIQIEVLPVQIFNITFKFEPTVYYERDLHRVVYNNDNNADTAYNV